MKRTVQYFLTLFLSLSLCVPILAQYDIGMPAMSTLRWADISSRYVESASAATIGLTTDGKVYTWGTNYDYSIHTNSYVTSGPKPKYQVAPYYVPFPAGVKIAKVRVFPNNIGGFRLPTFLALSESGTLYGWGVNGGYVGITDSSWPVNSTAANNGDTTKAIRKPLALTISGETSFVDVDGTGDGLYWAAVSSTGKAYCIGRVNGTTTPSTTFVTIPNPAGVGATFKYTNVWTGTQTGGAGNGPIIYLKGNDSNIYFTGAMSSGFATGVPSITDAMVPTLTLTSAEISGNVANITPRLVPFPAGEEIVSMKITSIREFNSNYAISKSGKAYIAGFWRVSYNSTSYGINWPQTYVIAPLSAAPAASDIYKLVSADTLVVLKRFYQIAMPTGATKVLDLSSANITEASVRNYGTLMATDDGKVHWSGSNNSNESGNLFYNGNYLYGIVPSGYTTFQDCGTIQDFATNSFYSWVAEAINYRGVAKIIKASSVNQQYFLISKDGVGYYNGYAYANAGIGMVSASTATGRATLWPAPIANELLYMCNTSPGTGGPVSNPTPGVGVIDCSKTKLYPAPVQGTPSELSLLVTINVTTIGDFSPITISGSGMSLVSGFDKVNATTTGVQTFHIPIKYDGSTLTNAFQFTIGSAGSCSADLTNKPSNEITKVWSLNNCTAITPGVLSK